MNASLINWYHRLPVPMRSCVAGARGYYLRSWRYGPETPRLVEQALERETWTPARWQRWREERLVAVLRHAATRVPFYRSWWEQRRRMGDRRSWEHLENWPILEKESVRQQWRMFLAEGSDPRHLLRQQTSGTTGKPLTLWHSRETLHAWYALVEARMRRWNGVSSADRWAILGGQLVAPVSQQRPPFWVWNAGLRQLYMSAYHLSPQHVESYLEALARYGVRYVLGYTSALHALAFEINRRGLQAPSLRFLMTNAEPLPPGRRESIEAAFGRPVRETYGMSEMVAGASECEAGRLHLWPEAGWIEVVRGGRGASPGTAGEFLCTGLLSMDMPLIRYRIGDSGALGGDGTACSCGRSLPVIAAIEGRTDDLLFTREGRSIGRLDPVFKADLRIREAQLIQDRLDSICVRYVPAPGFGAADAEAIRTGLLQRMGPVDVRFEPVEQIPRGPNGKFRAVVCKLTAEQRAAAFEGLR